uniref:Uncharacterized protein n=1 Tax=Arundo donax TaxID=35708 RepID=A0A0A9AJ29_ARUDO
MLYLCKDLLLSNLTKLTLHSNHHREHRKKIIS